MRKILIFVICNFFVIINSSFAQDNWAKDVANGPRGGVNNYSLPQESYTNTLGLLNDDGFKNLLEALQDAGVTVLPSGTLKTKNITRAMCCSTVLEVQLSNGAYYHVSLFREDNILKTTMYWGEVEKSASW